MNKRKVFKNRAYLKLVENEIKFLRNLIQHLCNTIDKMDKMLNNVALIDKNDARQVKSQLCGVKERAQMAELSLVTYLDHYKF